MTNAMTASVMRWSHHDKCIEMVFIMISCKKWCYNNKGHEISVIMTSAMILVHHEIGLS